VPGDWEAFDAGVEYCRSRGADLASASGHACARETARRVDGVRDAARPKVDVDALEKVPQRDASVARKDLAS
jgi:hypothetical protein